MELQSKTVRVLSLLRTQFPTLKTSHLREALTAGLVTLRGKPLKKGDRVSPHTPIQTTALETHLRELRKPSFCPELTVIKEEESWWIIDKPTGIASHPLSLFEKNTITHWAFSQFPEILSEFPEIQPTITPHRLDTGTSGLLIVAKNNRAYDEWRSYFKQRLVTKVYLAWCWGNPPNDRFVIRMPLETQKSDRRRVVSSRSGREAVSEIVVIHREDGRFLCKITTQTGVTHQVRAHLAYSGFPVLGDCLYDPAGSQRELLFPFHLLKAVRLSCLSFHYELSTKFPLPSSVR